MFKTTESAKLTGYIRSLKEIESLLTMLQAKNNDHSGVSVPAQWGEICHMARIAPALLQCLQECKSLLEQTHRALSKSAGELAQGEQNYLETMTNVLFSCDRVIEVALAGAIPHGKTLH